ncbi:DNA-directed RNA polymerase specialized sigma54-like protein [Sphingobacterium sp. JUb56]|nr:DNA-directed RNA polymerase specialized sigma54-like protein [Sphingobacterium sp. JUb56]
MPHENLEEFYRSSRFKNNNQTLDDAIVLVDSIDYCSDHLLKIIKVILFSKKNYFINYPV